MTISVRTGLTGLLLTSLLVISGCSSSSDDNDIDTPIDDDSSSQTPGVEIPTVEDPDTGTNTPVTGGDTTDGTDTDGTDTDGTDTDGTDTDGTDTDGTDTDGTDTDGTDTDGTDTDGTDTDGTDTDGTDTVDSSAPDNTIPDLTGSEFDASGGDDDSPTAVETASLAGPSIKDESRSAGPPSVPADLTLLLASEEWLEFSWAPSSDDQEVVAYNIYRDGSLIHTVQKATLENGDYEHDIRSWLSTSFIDCNYTRYVDCFGERVPVPGASYDYSVSAVDNEGMESEQSVPATFTFEALTSDLPDLAGYETIFEEEFEEDQLDRTKWKTALHWGADTTVNLETQYFVNIFAADPLDYSPFEFTGTTMKITGKETPPELLEAANNQPYLSGVITTSDYFKMTYGYVEMSAKLASGEGLLSTFYLFNQDYLKNKPEIDIVEYDGQDPMLTHQTYHYYDSNRVRVANQINGEKHSSPTMKFTSASDLSAGFHKYSVLWEPGLVVWYIDGQEIHRMTGVRVSDEPMNIIAHLVVGSSWIGAPSAESLPAEFEIDYIRASQKP